RAEVISRSEHRKATHADVLADLRDQRATTLINRLATRQLRAKQSLGRGRLGGQSGGRHGLRKAAEVLLARDEVGLAINLHQSRGVRVSRFLDNDHTLGGYARRL